MKLALLTAAILCASVALLAQPNDPLADLENTKEMRKLGRANKTGLGSQAWIDPASNYAKLFGRNAEPRIVFEWLGLVTEGYSAGKKVFYDSIEYVMPEMLYYLPDRREITLTVIVPHPRSQHTAELKLVKAFAALEPPALTVKDTQDLKIRELAAKLYIQPEEKCSLLIKLTKGTVANLKMNKCYRTQDLVDLAVMLDFERLNKKLEN